ncbi:unnamed protein product [Tilletia controversa]|uniref:HTH TFE/IIEalpha-type domain-containing protein n=3 Tax=Tilletia TaxID=13289 RepID=A0A8X7MLB1_9BASI|nr:hypothetical protein CF336_g7866 [Tilletia laevis]KAE8186380.1 hypothetical protein CF328_g7247 [Tilletia controversa]KAE8243429.1 hypothetical protein A4X03_0g7769 [Tilletia caries]KAE8187104.1 hypothetical protein CF335_g7266 [Tilletia laevis]KAE8239298.1 hypothetical protein A4X06_0g8371 [Tilletia controversa]
MASSSRPAAEMRTVPVEFRAATKKDIRRVKVLVQRIGRLFYDDPQIILLDQLCTVEIIPAEVLAGRMGRSIKEVGSMLNTLLEHRLVSTHRRTEIRDPTNPHARAVNRSYYYLSFPHFLKVIRWRMMSLNKQIQDQGSRNLENKGFICPRCGKTYDSLDVANLYDPFSNELCCDVPGCGTALKHDENREEARKGQEKGRKFNEQCSSILRLLASLEGVLLPHFDPEEYILANMDAETWKHPKLDCFDLPENEGTDDKKTAGPSNKASSSKHGLTDAQIASRPLPGAASSSSAGGGVSVRLVGNDPAEEAAVRKAKEQEAANYREQNQLPEWHLMSTVSGEATSLGMKEDARRAKDAQFGGGVDGDRKGKGRADGDGVGEDGEDDYYAQYAQLQDEDPVPGAGGLVDEDNLEFEDITDDEPATPAKSNAAAKRRRDDDGDDHDDGVAARTDHDGQRGGTNKKKARTEDVIVISDDEGGPMKKQNGGAGGGGGGFGEEDLDFEEVE